MLISIIVPVYNVSAYLPGCLDSILANDTSDCEIILVDDGATDDSGAICDAYAREHPALIRVIHQPNGGLGAARNTGMEAAAGTWFLFVDSDDKLHRDTISVLKQAAVKQENVEIIGFQFFSDNGVDQPVPQTAFAPTESPFTLKARRDYLLSLPSAWLRLWHRRLFMETGIRFPSKVWYEDIRTTAKILPLARGITVLPQNLYYYLSRPGSIMNSAKLDRNREILQAMDDILAWYRQEGLYDLYREELCALTVQHVLLAGSVRVARSDPAHPLLKEFYAYTEAAFPDWEKNAYNKSLPRTKRLALTLVRRRRYRLLNLLFRLKG